MSITFQCSGCQAKYTVDDSAAGKTATCKKCGTKLTVPQPPPPEPDDDDDMYELLEDELPSGAAPGVVATPAAGGAGPAASTAAATTIACPVCNAPVASTAPACPTCGSALETGGAAAASAGRAPRGAAAGGPTLPTEHIVKIVGLVLLAAAVGGPIWYFQTRASYAEVINWSKRATRVVLYNGPHGDEYKYDLKMPDPLSVEHWMDTHPGLDYMERKGDGYVNHYSLTDNTGYSELKKDGHTVMIHFKSGLRDAVSVTSVTLDGKELPQAMWAGLAADEW